MQLRNVLPNLASPRSLVAVVMMSPTKENSPIKRFEADWSCSTVLRGLEIRGSER
jgi:hypothetical protein